MRQLVYTKVAVDDLQRLRAFIAERDPRSAGRVAAELGQRITKLCEFPLIGRTVPEAPDPEVVRDMVFGGYVVRYAVHPEIVAILRIWHHFEAR